MSNEGSWFLMMCGGRDFFGVSYVVLVLGVLLNKCFHRRALI